MAISENIIPPACDGADPEPKTPVLKVPKGSCDCHAHILGPQDRFPYAPKRSYTPPDASFEDYTAMLAALGLERAVIVQPSVYGTDNRVTLDAVSRGGENFRGVAVVDDTVTPDEIRYMDDTGIRGVRMNLLFEGGIEISSFEKLVSLIEPYGWHIQVLIDVSVFTAFDVLEQLPVDVVFDHMGHVPAYKGIGDPGFQRMLRMISDGRAWAKLSGAYRMTGLQSCPYEDTDAYARAILEANEDRAVWATDWPHPSIPVSMPNDGDLLDILPRWAPDEKTRQKILVDNPAKLYGF